MGGGGGRGRDRVGGGGEWEGKEGEQNVQRVSLWGGVQL